MHTRAENVPNREIRTGRCRSRAAIVWIALLMLAALAVPMRAAADAQDVSLGGVWIGHIEHGAQGLSAGERATEVAKRLTEVLSDPAMKAGTVVVLVRAVGNDATISVGQHLIMTVTQDDAAPTSVTPLVMAEQWAGRLARALTRALAVSRVRLDTPDGGVTTVAGTGAGAPASGNAQGGASTASSAAPAGSSTGTAPTTAASGSSANQTGPQPGGPGKPSTASAQGSPGKPVAGQPVPGAQGTHGGTATSAAADVSEVQLTPTSETHVAPGGRVTFVLSYKVQGSIDSVDVTVGWQGIGGELTYGRFVHVAAKPGDNTINDVWFDLSKETPRYYTFRVYAVVKVGDTILRSSPVMVIVK